MENDNNLRVTYGTEYELCFDGQWFSIPSALAIKLKENPSPFVPEIRHKHLRIESTSGHSSDALRGGHWNAIQKTEVAEIPEGAEMGWEY